MSISSVAQESALRFNKGTPGAPNMQEVADAAATAAVAASEGGASQTEAVEKGKEAASSTQGSTPTVSSGPLSTLVKYIPTETISLYIAIQAALGDVTTPKGKGLSDADFSSHWTWLVVMLLATIALTLALSYRAQRDASPGSGFQVPYFDITASGAAFLVWALSLPSTPLRDIAGYDYTAWNSVLILGGTIAIATAAHAFGKTVTWDKVLTEA